jgi:hypothetical protein
MKEMEDDIECGILKKEMPQLEIVKCRGKSLASIICYMSCFYLNQNHIYSDDDFFIIFRKISWQSYGDGTNCYQWGMTCCGLTIATTSKSITVGMLMQLAAYLAQAVSQPTLISCFYYIFISDVLFANVNFDD